MIKRAVVILVMIVLVFGLVFLRGKNQKQEVLEPSPIYRAENQLPLPNTPPIEIKTELSNLKGLVEFPQLPKSSKTLSLTNKVFFKKDIEEIAIKMGESLVFEESFGNIIGIKRDEKIYTSMIVNNKKTSPRFLYSKMYLEEARQQGKPIVEEIENWKIEADKLIALLPFADNFKPFFVERSWAKDTGELGARGKLDDFDGVEFRYSFKYENEPILSSKTAYPIRVSFDKYGRFLALYVDIWPVEVIVENQNLAVKKTEDFFYTGFYKPIYLKGNPDYYDNYEEFIGKDTKVYDVFVGWYFEEEKNRLWPYMFLKVDTKGENNTQVETVLGTSLIL